MKTQRLPRGCSAATTVPRLIACRTVRASAVTSSGASPISVRHYSVFNKYSKQKTPASRRVFLIRYTINGRFSNVPSVTRTFTSISMNIESGDCFLLPGNMFGDNKWLVFTVNFVTK